MTVAEGQDALRFDSFEFDERSGELRHGMGESSTVSRLSPQPAKLLSHLIRRRPHIVGADEIRELLWPDVQVEFEQSLHSCVRQIRSALGDSAAEPRYVETIPRRGYRFLVDLEPTVEQAVAPTRAAPSARRRQRPAALIGASLGVLLLALVPLWVGGGPPVAPLRIAVMPFEPTGEASPLPPNNDIAESTMARLIEQASSPLEIVGPTTTMAYDDSAERLRELIREFDIDYVINARETSADTGSRVLVEVIRASDGAHVWVRYLDDFPADQTVSETIAGAVAEACASLDR